MGRAGHRQGQDDPTECDHILRRKLGVSSWRTFIIRTNGREGQAQTRDSEESRASGKSEGRGVIVPCGQWKPSLLQPFYRPAKFSKPRPGMV
jgi:hypothetical protein